MECYYCNEKLELGDPTNTDTRSGLIYCCVGCAISDLKDQLKVGRVTEEDLEGDI